MWKFFILCFSHLCFLLKIRQEQIMLYFCTIGSTALLTIIDIIINTDARGTHHHRHTHSVVVVVVEVVKQVFIFKIMFVLNVGEQP